MKHPFLGKICLFHVTIYIKLLYCYWTQDHNLCPNKPGWDTLPLLSYLKMKYTVKRKKWRLLSRESIGKRDGKKQRTIPTHVLIEGP